MRALLPVIGVAALSLAACGGDDDRPAPVTGCIQGVCGGAGGTGGGTGGGGGGSCTPIPSQGTRFTGSLNVFISDQFDEPGDTDLYFDPYIGTAEVMIPGEPCGWVSDDYDSSAGALFDLQGVLKEEELYFRMDPVDSQTPVMPTIMVVNALTDNLDSPYYGFVKQTTMEGILAAAGLTPEPDKAQIVVRAFTGIPLTPATGAQLRVAGAGATIYDAGGWTTNASGAGADGTVVLANVSAEPWPGGPLTVVADNSDDQYVVHAAQGAVTFLWVTFTYRATGP